MMPPISPQQIEAILNMLKYAYQNEHAYGMPLLQVADVIGREFDETAVDLFMTLTYRDRLELYRKSREW